MKKQQQLGMNPGTASHRLVKDILWSLIVETNKDFCYKCNAKLTRETFSIEHKIPWLDSENPLELFFDINNISFSHLKCNVGSKRDPKKGTGICGTISQYQRGCRCSECRNAARIDRAKYPKKKVQPL